MRKLYPSEKPEEILRKLDGERVSKIGIVFLAGSFLCGTVWWFGKGEAPVAVLERPEYGKKEVVYELEAEKEDGVRFPVEVAVSEQTLTRVEAERRMEEAYEEICRDMLGENESAGHVDQDLELPEKAFGGLVQVEWRSKTREVFNDWGELTKRPGARPPDGEKGIYELSLSCGGYECQYELELTVYPPKQTEGERFSEAMETEIKREAEEESQGKDLSLPEAYEGERLTWFVKEEETGIWIFWIVLTACALLAVRERQKEKEKLKEREREMLMDYPELVGKFTVLLQAGLAARNVWEQMVTEYGRQKKRGKKPRYAYEEMEITWNQLKNGMYEGKAYGDFGRRCGLHVYMKLGALLEQNLRQGTTGLALGLKEEAELAFEERKNLARRLGEEAETRLMLPMFLMLFMVLTVIMVPAFLSF
ncbi:MAG: hypothetical protein HFI67_00835 [Lachnospiraceae bacterium]|nr:hypothetical protein [Lachnospiraceae bacterium]